MQIKDLFELDPALSLLAGSEGLGRNIETVSVMDAPDIYRWMKGGELLLTSGYVMHQSESSLADLILLLHEANVAGLAIKVERYLASIPQEVLDLCNELAFPLIFIPGTYAFSDMISTILKEILSEKNRQLRLSRNIHNRFTDIVIKGYGIQEIIDVLSQFINKKVAYYDDYFDRLYVSKAFEEKREVEAATEETLELEVEIGSLYLGRLTISDYAAELTEEENIAVEQATTVLKLEMQKEISNYRTNQKYLDQLVQDIILNNIKTQEELDNRARIYGIESNTNGVICIIVDIDDYKAKLTNSDSQGISELNRAKDSIFDIARTHIDLIDTKQALYMLFSDQLVMLLEPEEANNYAAQLKGILELIRSQIEQQSNHTVTIGVGEYKGQMMQAHQSYIEAREAVKAVHFEKGGNVIRLYNEIWYYKVIHEMSESNNTISFLNKYLRKLELYDWDNNTDYVETLKALIDNNWNYKDTCEQLFVHYNTIKYRVDKIQEILGINLKSENQRFQLKLFFTMKALTANE